MKSFWIAFIAGMIVAAGSMAVSRADGPEAVGTPAPAVPAAIGAPAPSAAPANADTSRYRFYNNYWWYLTQDNRWLCYVNGQWIDPTPPAPPAAAAPAAAPAGQVYAYPAYTVVPQPYYYPYPYDYPYPAFGGIYIGGGWGGGWHGGYGYHHH